MADTALDIVTNALLDLGVIADDETPSASQGIGGLRKLNNMIEAWNIQELLVYGATQNIFPLVAGQGSYTITTPSGRPNMIQSAYVRNTAPPAAQVQDIPLYIFTQAEYANQSFKSMTSTFPYGGVYFDMGYPNITAYLLPIPSTGQYSLVVWTEGIISNLASLNTPISLASGYKRALESNLAIELAAGYGVEVPATTAKIAMNSIKWLKTQNFQLNELLQTFAPVQYDALSNRYIV